MSPHRRSPLASALRLITIAVLTLTAGAAHAQSIGGTGSWTLSLSAANLQSGAGSQLGPIYRSSTTASQINIGILFNLPWHVTVQRSDINWFPLPYTALTRNGVGLQVMRTSAWGGGSVTGGTSFVRIDTSPVTFVSGNGNISMYLQYRIFNLSLQYPPGTYTTSVIFTVFAN